MDQIPMTTQVLSFAGALLILIGYVGHQLKWLDSGRPFYNIVNAIGAAILGWVAFRPFQVGFVMLESVWTIVSLVALWRSLKRGPAAA